MKKIFVLAVLAMLSLTIMAQNAKKVAILETVDKENKVSYGVKLQLRSSLTYAISSTPGYEGYDRVDMSSILGEHNFQRTGYVSDAQIKKLGEMTGASSILVAEAAIYDASHIIVTAKILNVETASVENSAPPQIAGTDPEEMQKACTQLASKLIGGSSFDAPAKTISKERGALNGHMWVNLGLPSGTMWATSNVGALSSKEQGLLLSWGETEMKDYYGDENYKFCYGPTKHWDNYTTYRDIHYDGDVMAATDDAATVNWGEGWSTPTNGDWEELINNCTWKMDSDGGVAFVGPNGNSIYLANAGYKCFDKHILEYGLSYMSSTWAYCFSAYESFIGVSECNPRFGYSVRPVCHP